MKKLLLICALCTIANTISTEVHWNDPNDITKGGSYLFTDVRGVGMAALIQPGTKAEVEQRLQTLQAQHPSVAGAATQIHWHNPSDITKGGAYLFTDARGIGMAAPIFPGTKAQIEQRLRELQAKYPAGAR